MPRSAPVNSAHLIEGLELNSAPIVCCPLNLQVPASACIGSLRRSPETHSVRVAGESAEKGVGFLQAITDIGKKGNLPQKVFRRKDGELSVFGRLAAGVCGGMISTLVTYPLDVLRLRLAVQSGHNTMSQVALNMLRLREEGLASFYGGLGLSLIAFAPYITAGCIHSQQSQNICEHALVGYTIGQASERCADLQVLEFI
ncbi:uncharacterized protein C2845_PM17G13110 [Panicum miliaceum]|uniref:Uncharacterized protein n=1 Tax=Panicum miliaceum TaxID=4540 RepID=A0A3L6Q176_PANMI|nr:uncharacterized protein C2845_PM17G13110 [Panicum miliaceum]